MRSVIVVAVFVFAAVAGAQDLQYVPNSTQRVCQLTGDVDRVAGQPTLSQTGKRFGVTATDLGSTFEHKGRLYFLFGDTWGRPGDLDAVAWTESKDPLKVVLDFHKDADGKWLPPRAHGIKQGAFEVPSGGVSIDDAMYVVFTTDHSATKTMGRSVLAMSRDDGKTFRVLYELPRDKFINVSLWRMNEDLYLFGSGEYRKSSVYLARIRTNDIADRSKLSFFNGKVQRGGHHAGSWTAEVADAAPLFRHEVVGELSAAYLPQVERFVMLYNSSKPRGIMMRSAPAPTGPWSDGTIIFEPWRDRGYGHFMHISAKAKKKSDGLSDPNRENEWGGEYGPYLLPRFARKHNDRCRIYYTMSTWNPYQVVIMQSDIELVRSR